MAIYYYAKARGSNTKAAGGSRDRCLNFLCLLSRGNKYFLITVVAVFLAANIITLREVLLIAAYAVACVILSVAAEISVRIFLRTI